VLQERKKAYKYKYKPKKNDKCDLYEKCVDENFVCSEIKWVRLGKKM